MPRVKICCIGSVPEARAALARGASAIGLVSEMPSGPGVIPEERIAEIVRALPPAVETFLLTSRTDAEAIAGQQARTGVNTIQLCDRLPDGEYPRLRAALTGVRLVQVIHVRGPEALEEARILAPRVDRLLLDSGNPDGAVRELGGTGRTHDWRLSRNIRESVGIPVYLAGGLTPANVELAIRTVRPYGVDVCSGVRRGGKLDDTILDAFFGAVARAGNPD
ncbi:MAG: phosphoribosylanthranilate isomerase [Gemmatimonadota bacterium]